MKTVSFRVPETYEEFVNCLVSGGYYTDDFRLIDRTKRREWLRRLINSKIKLNNLFSLPYILETEFNLSCSLPNKTRHDFYHYIPLNTLLFLNLIKTAIPLVNTKPVKFIDAGCGIGDKIKLTEYFFNDVYASGVEYDKTLILMAKMKYDAYNDGRISIYEGDITEFDFSPYNLIYAYNPIRTDEGMLRFFANIIRTAKSGTICAFANVSSGEAAIHELRKCFKNIGYVRPDCRVYRLVN